MEQYATSSPGLQCQTRMRGPGGVPEAPAPVEEPSGAELLAAIQGSCVVLQGKIEAVAVEVNLLRMDLRKVSDKVKVAEGSIVDLQAEGISGANGRVEIQQDGTMAVVVPEVTDESTEPSDVRMESVSVDN
ncbi:hypothetical protein NDU88_006746 [Pleurodeles waltl]|uniref:Uncharacterized protein n=1 Tax=Pleurodeles waltl TaxID=8319 RepID=A0AAV7N9I7_PLEWA|nr:hypothetical protein NDU88_006746 [Pleurodeles waltl]